MPKTDTVKREDIDFGDSYLEFERRRLERIKKRETKNGT